MRFRVALSCGDYGTGGRKPSPHSSREVATHQKWLKSVGEWLLRSTCEPVPPPSLRDTEGTQGGRGILWGTTALFQVCRQAKSSWRDVCCTNIRSLTENSVCSTPIFFIQVPRSLQLCLKEVSRQGLLSTGCQEDGVILFCIFQCFLKVG